MANFLDKFKIKTAWNGRAHTKDLSCEHVTTSDFMKLQPVYYHHFIPKEKLTVDFRAFSRMAAMPVPTFGRANLNVRAFFVPYRTVFGAWNDFITDSIHTFADGSSSIPASVPTVLNSDLINALVLSSDLASGDDYDFGVLDNGVTITYKFTNYGRHYYKLLESLGYHICFDKSVTTAFSALPLLCFAKVVLDWYWPSAYVGNPDFVAYTSIVSNDLPNRQLSSSDLEALLSLGAVVNYDSDYFVSSFDNPAGPSSGLSSSFDIADSSLTTFNASNINHIVTAGDGTPVISKSGSTAVNSVSQYAIEALHRLTDYMKRHQLAGARSLERYLARFGVQLSAEKMVRSVYLGSHKVPMMTGDVMSTSDTLLDGSGSRVGDYAGKGFLVGNDGHFDFESDEYGMFIICSSIVPEIGYYQGIDRHNMHLTRLDHFTPEFDGMGTRAIPKCELYLSQVGSVFDKDRMTQIFGYTPQYSEYKCGKDWLTGDYRVRSINRAGDTSQSWHLFRDMSLDESHLVHSLNFVRGFFDRTQYNRVFYNTSSNVDHFYMHFFFGVKSTSRTLPLYDEYDFHNEEGNDKVMDVNGVKMN